MYKKELVPVKQKINGTISAAINRYISMGVPLKQLLSDYNDILTYPELLKTAVNPWESINIKKGVTVVCGVSKAEALFNVSAMSLYRQQPITVIKSIYYRNNVRNDSALESIFVDYVLDKITCDQKLLIINPSPIVVELVEHTRKNTAYIVIDQTMASLYSKQFKQTEFIAVDEMHSVSNIDVMIVSTSNIDEKSLQELLKKISTVHAEKIIGIFQTRLINNKESLFWKSILKDQYAVRNVIIMPKEVTNSMPRSKCLVYVEGKVENTELTIQKMEYNRLEKEVSLGDQRLIVTQEELLGCKTINQLWKKTAPVKTKEEKETEYSSAELYAFSREIQLSYALYRDKSGYYAKAYYSATKYTHLPTVRGRALTKRVERGLRAGTIEQVIDALEKIPYINQMSEAIIADITTYYLNTGKSVTLKTLWFCLRTVLQKNPSYDDNIMAALFSKGNTISDLYPDSDNGEAFKEAIGELFEEGEEIQELRLLKMVNMIISEAVKHGYLTENRILPLIPAAQNRATKRQAEVRQALTKRSFESLEEQKMMKYLLPLCVRSSIHLSVLIRMMTGISIREVCGLLWSDYKFNDEIDIFTLSVTKLVNSDGKTSHHILQDNWEKYRVLPLPRLLGKIIQARKEYLIREGLSAQVLEEYPIILPRENIDRMKKGYRPINCKPSSVAEKCREAVKVAEIPQLQIFLPDRDGSELETDFNSYGGDIFRSNFRDKALNVAGFELDEVNYYLGIKRPDTFSQHYCDYTNQYVQLQIARKLDRWAEHYEYGIKTEYSGMSTTRTINGIGDGVPCAEIEIDKNEAENDSITIRVESMHGFNVSVATYKRRINDA